MYSTRALEERGRFRGLAHSHIGLFGVGKGLARERYHGFNCLVLVFSILKGRDGNCTLVINSASLALKEKTI